MNRQRAEREWEVALLEFRVEQEGVEWSEDALTDIAECFLWIYPRQWEEWARALGMSRSDVLSAAADIITEVGTPVTQDR